MPVRELLTSNGLVTGQPSASPVESVHWIAEPLVEAGHTLFVLDPTGNFGDLADHPAVLHAGGDRTCDVQVGPGAVDRVASLVIDGGTSIVLDLSAFEDGVAADVLGGVTAAFVDPGPNREANLLLVVDECHRWLGDTARTTRTGENLVRLGGRGYEETGIVGVTDQPADVRTDVLTGVDWLLAHRLTWREDVDAVGRLLDSRYVHHLEDLEPDEAFLNAGWDAGVQRIRFGDGSNGRQAEKPTDSAEGRPAHEQTAARTARGEPAKTPESPSREGAPRPTGTEATQPTNGHPPRSKRPADEDLAAIRDDVAEIEKRLASLEERDDTGEAIETLGDRIADAITEGLADARIVQDRTPRDDDSSGNDRNGARSTSDEADETADATADTGSTDTAVGTGDGGAFGDVFGMFDDDSAESTDAAAESTEDTTTDGQPAAADGTSPSTHEMVDDDSSRDSAAEATSGGMSFEPMDFGFEDPTQELDSTVPEDFGPPSRRGSSGRTLPKYLRTIVRKLEEMDVTTRRMLAYYVEEGAESPMDAHFSAGGGSDRTRAYAYNRQLRTTGLVEHVGKGKYAPRLREYVVDEAGHSVPEHELDRAIEVIRQTVEAA